MANSPLVYGVTIAWYLLFAYGLATYISWIYLSNKSRPKDASNQEIRNAYIGAGPVLMAATLIGIFFSYHLYTIWIGCTIGRGFESPKDRIKSSTVYYGLITFFFIVGTIFFGVYMDRALKEQKKYSETTWVLGIIGGSLLLLAAILAYVNFDYIQKYLKECGFFAKVEGSGGAKPIPLDNFAEMISYLSGIPTTA